MKTENVKNVHNEYVHNEETEADIYPKTVRISEKKSRDRRKGGYYGICEICEGHMEGGVCSSCENLSGYN